MAVASLVGCTWCLDFGYFAARDEELELEKAREVPRWRESELFTPMERDVMGYAEAMSQTPPSVTDEMSARLLDHLGAPLRPGLIPLVLFDLPILLAVRWLEQPSRAGQERVYVFVQIERR